MELVLRIGQQGLHGHVAGLFLDFRFEGVDLREKRSARPGVGPHVHFAADTHLWQVLLRQVEFHVELLEIGKSRDGVAGVEILPEVDAADAELAAERRADVVLLDTRIELPHGGLRLFELGFVLVECLTRLDMAWGQLARSIQLDGGEAGLRLRGSAVRDLGGFE